MAFLCRNLSDNYCDALHGISQSHRGPTALMSCTASLSHLRCALSTAPLKLRSTDTLEAPSVATAANGAAASRKPVFSVRNTHAHQR